MNGFHPLYSFLCSKPASLELLTLDARSVGTSPRFNKFKDVPFLGPSSDSMRAVYDNFFVREDFEYNAQFYDITELHHTCPPLYVHNSFYFHFESFLPIFMPYAFQGGGSNIKSNLNLVRNSYKALFESEKCLGIVSHISGSLKEFSQFFESEIIDKKIKHIPIGYLPAKNTDAAISVAISDMLKNCRKYTTFIFNNSTSGYDRQFILRGGIIALKLALKYIAHGYKYKFIFRCNKPSKLILKKYEVDEKLLLDYENDSIFWVDKYLSDSEMDALYRSADFNLLISANLHSSSILRSMYHGCIPVISDTRGTEEYALDLQNCILISGVKDQVWSQSDKFNYYYDDHKKYEDKNFINKLTEIAFDKISTFCIQEHKIRLSRNCKSFVKNTHNPIIRAKELTDFFSPIPSTVKSPFNEMLMALDEDKFFGSTSPKKLNNLGQMIILEFGGIYYLAKNTDPVYPKNISVFSKSRFHCSAFYNDIIDSAFDDSHISKYSKILMYIKRKHPRAYEFIRHTYRKIQFIIFNTPAIYYFFSIGSKLLRFFSRKK